MIEAVPRSAALAVLSRFGGTRLRRATTNHPLCLHLYRSKSDQSLEHGLLIESARTSPNPNTWAEAGTTTFRCQQWDAWFSIVYKSIEIQLNCVCALDWPDARCRRSVSFEIAASAFDFISIWMASELLLSTHTHTRDISDNIGKFTFNRHGSSHDFGDSGVWFETPFYTCRQTMWHWH